MDNPHVGARSERFNGRWLPARSRRRHRKITRLEFSLPPEIPIQVLQDRKRAGLVPHSQHSAEVEFELYFSQKVHLPGFRVPAHERFLIEWEVPMPGIERHGNGPWSRGFLIPRVARPRPHIIWRPVKDAVHRLPDRSIQRVAACLPQARRRAAHLHEQRAIDLILAAIVCPVGFNPLDLDKPSPPVAWEMRGIARESDLSRKNNASGAESRFRAEKYGRTYAGTLIDQDVRNSERGGRHRLVSSLGMD